jgi:predicted nucleotide-binding protein
MINNSNGQNLKYDVFISYSHMDSEWVNNVLIPRLEELNLSIYIDTKIFTIGQPIILEIEKAINNSKKVIVKR